MKEYIILPIIKLKKWSLLILKILSTAQYYSIINKDTFYQSAKII